MKDRFLIRQKGKKVIQLPASFKLAFISLSYHESRQKSIALSIVTKLALHYSYTPSTAPLFF